MKLAHIRLIKPQHQHQQAKRYSYLKDVQATHVFGAECPGDNWHREQPKRSAGNGTKGKSRNFSSVQAKNSSTDRTTWWRSDSGIP